MYQLTCTYFPFIINHVKQLSSARIQALSYDRIIKQGDDEMKICGIIVTILYACLMIFAVCKNKAKDISSALIAIGCLFLLAYAFCSMIWPQNLIVISILGMIGISAGTLLNGIKQKSVHIHHHIIRLVIESIIIAVCWIG